MAQHRRHPVDGREQRRVGFEPARDEALAQRQQVEQQLDEAEGLRLEMPAVGQDLALQLGRQQLPRLRELPFVAGDAQIGMRPARSGPAAAGSRRARCARRPRDR